MTKQTTKPSSKPTRAANAIRPGRAAMLTERDLELLRILAFCPLLTVDQIFRLDLPGADRYSSRTAETRSVHRVEVPSRGFINRERARQQLYRLQRKGYLTSYKAGPNYPTMWRLTGEGHHAIVTQQLRLDELHGIDLPYNDYQPDVTRASHHNTLNDIFVSVQPILTELFGEPPNWDWWSERRAFDAVDRGSQGRVRYMPDAELHLDGVPIIIERQTKHARKSPEEIAKKVEDHTQYHTRSQPGRPALRKNQFHILFACDAERDAEAARQAARAQGVQLFADTPTVAVQYIYQIAHQLSEKRHKSSAGRIQHDRGNEASRGVPTRSDPNRHPQDDYPDLDDLPEAAF